MPGGVSSDASAGSVLKTSLGIVLAGEHVGKDGRFFWAVVDNERLRIDRCFSVAPRYSLGEKHRSIRNLGRYHAARLQDIATQRFTIYSLPPSTPAFDAGLVPRQAFHQANPVERLKRLSGYEPVAKRQAAIPSQPAFNTPLVLGNLYRARLAQQLRALLQLQVCRCCAQVLQL